MEKKAKKVMVSPVPGIPAGLWSTGLAAAAAASVAVAAELVAAFAGLVASGATGGVGVSWYPPLSYSPWTLFCAASFSSWPWSLALQNLKRSCGRTLCKRIR